MPPSTAGPVLTSHPLSRPPSVPALTRYTSKPRMAPLAPAGPSAPAPAIKSSPPPPVPAKDPPAASAPTTAAPANGQQAAAPTRKHKSKSEFRDPPKTVLDRASGEAYQVISVLGQGGFARVYEARDSKGRSLALKVINKGKLADTKARTRLYAEIKIHRALNHPHVCAFGDCFEDGENVYITLELCRAGSLMDFVRKRARLTEPEVRLYMVQLSGAIRYLHTHQIIHRDLKLGNLFLDDRLELKVGDFGLAALLEREGERKTTICGTPNYIAPEVLFASKTMGHSYEVDIWSMGVIMFTMLTGKPPFQTDKVEDIYRRIRDSKYEFPTTFEISPSAKNLVQKLLSQKPEDRPTPQNLLSHPFFTEGHCPLWMSQVSRTHAPTYTPQEQLKSAQNLRALRKRAQIDEVGSIRVRREGVLAPSSTNNSQVADSTTASEGAKKAQEQQQAAARAWEAGEREFEQAVNVGSPISALLKSAKQPLVVAGELPAENLMRKLSVQALSANANRKGKEQQQQQEKASIGAGGRGAGGRGKTLRSVDEEVRASPKAGRAMSLRRTTARERDSSESENVPPIHGSTRTRPASASAATTGAGGATGGKSALPVLSRGPSQTGLNRQGSQSGLSRQASQGQGQQRDVRQSVQARLASAAAAKRQEAVAAVALADADEGDDTEVEEGRERAGKGEKEGRGNTFDRTARVLNDAFEAKGEGRVWRDPELEADLPGKVVFVQSWVDYSHKYGMGYALTDGTTGVYFNDSSTLVLSPDNEHFDHVTPNPARGQYARASRTMSSFPSSGSASFSPSSRTRRNRPSGSSDDSSSTDLSDKVTLLRAFKEYIYRELYRQQAYTYVDTDKREGMDFVQKWLRANNVTMFKLSNEAIQFNYSDHTKVILSSLGRHVTYVDKTYNLHEYTLAQLMADAVAPPAGRTSEEIKNNERLLKRLRYCREVLNTMQRRNLCEEEGNLQAAGSVGSLGSTKTAGLR